MESEREEDGSGNPPMAGDLLVGSARERRRGPPTTLELQKRLEDFQSLILQRLAALAPTGGSAGVGGVTGSTDAGAGSTDRGSRGGRPLPSQTSGVGAASSMAPSQSIDNPQPPLAPPRDGEHTSSGGGDEMESDHGDELSRQMGGTRVVPPSTPVEGERDQLACSFAAHLAGVSSMAGLRAFAEDAESVKSLRAAIDTVVDLSPLATNPFVGPVIRSKALAVPGSAEEVSFFALPQELQDWKLKGFSEDPRRVFHEVHVVLHYRFRSLQLSLDRNAIIVRLLKLGSLPVIVVAAVERVLLQAILREVRELQLLMRRHQIYSAYIHGKDVSVVQSLQRQRDEAPIFADKELAARFADFEQSALKSAMKIQQKRLAEKMLSHSSTHTSAHELEQQAAHVAPPTSGAPPKQRFTQPGGWNWKANAAAAASKASNASAQQVAPAQHHVSQPASSSFRGGSGGNSDSSATSAGTAGSSNFSAHA